MLPCSFSDLFLHRYTQLLINNSIVSHFNSSVFIKPHFLSLKIIGTHQKQ